MSGTDGALDALRHREGWSLPRKARFWIDRYGWIQAAAVRVGLACPRIWRWLGPRATRAYVRRWLRAPGTKILNLGGGGNLRADWLTVDIDPRADAYVDLTRPLPFPDASLDAVFCEEAIEHLSFADAGRLLAECRRCLKPGGVLRLTTPDLAFFTDLWAGRRPLSGGTLTRELDAPLGGAAAVNAIFYGHGHRFIYDAETLTEQLQRAGFDHVERSRYRDPSSRLGPYDSHADRMGDPPEQSLYLECRAPRES